MRPVLLLALATVVATSNRGRAQTREPDLAVIVYPGTEATSLSADELEAIFSAARHNWSNGRGIVALNYPPRDPIRARFDLAVMGLSPDQVGRFWVDQRIRSGVRPPRQIDSPSIAVRLVAKVPGAIAYVPVTLVDASVRVVAYVRDGKVVPQ